MRSAATSAIPVQADLSLDIPMQSVLPRHAGDIARFMRLVPQPPAKVSGLKVANVSVDDSAKPRHLVVDVICEDPARPMDCLRRRKPVAVFRRPGGSCRSGGRSEALSDSGRQCRRGGRAGGRRPPHRGGRRRQAACAKLARAINPVLHRDMTRAPDLGCGRRGSRQRADGRDFSAPRGRQPKPLEALRND